MALTALQNPNPCPIKQELAFGDRRITRWKIAIGYHSSFHLNEVQIHPRSPATGCSFTTFLCIAPN
ncbi:hypothetical protein F7734_36580 [Scytonema sp. UIC 10036]|uniref:hypothetical protein n=1 Tax=Scytonema sp. UIC 10036 TaxID=2304196 RepID=UPI0012DAC2D9|nr:hypothetical protein [Scytonema sp. UIC 10036]MUG97548.1 hypothetical protein [Scytonema sp. UIC 10036]